MNKVGKLVVGKDTVRMDYTVGRVEVYLKEPVSDDLMQHYADYFADKQRITVFFSGGLDSQFSLALARKFCTDVIAVTIQYNWQDDIVNAADVMLSKAYCEKHQIPHVVEHIDLQDFLTNHLTDTARKYHTPSPQISAHLYAINRSAYTDRPMLMGGEVPYVCEFEGAAFLPVAWVPDHCKSSTDFFNRFLAPFEIFNSESDYKIIRDPFLVTPEIYYLSIKHNLSVIEKTRSVSSLDIRKTNTSFWPYKQLYYASFGLDLSVPLKKRTGFEPLKTHLASETGVYNEFDIRYRHQILEECNREKWFGTRTPRSEYVGDELVQLLEQATALFQQVSPTNCNSYNFEEM
jgi:hypothetical protein